MQPGCSQNDIHGKYSEENMLSWKNEIFFSFYQFDNLIGDVGFKEWISINISQLTMGDNYSFMPDFGTISWYENSEAIAHNSTIYPTKYVHGSHLAVLGCGLAENNFDCLMQKRLNSIALAMELRLLCIKPSILRISSGFLSVTKGQLYNCLSATEVTLKDTGKCIIWIH